MGIVGVLVGVFVVSSLGISLTAFKPNDAMRLQQMKDELEVHNIRMRYMKMQSEKEMLSGGNRCSNTNPKNLL